MGLYAILCPICGDSHVWFSGNLDQRCGNCRAEGRTQRLSEEQLVELQKQRADSNDLTPKNG